MCKTSFVLACMSDSISGRRTGSLHHCGHVIMLFPPLWPGSWAEKTGSEAWPCPPGSWNPLSVPPLSTMTGSVTRASVRTKGAPVICEVTRTHVWGKKEKHII